MKTQTDCNASQFHKPLIGTPEYLRTVIKRSHHHSLDGTTGIVLEADKTQVKRTLAKLETKG